MWFGLNVLNLKVLFGASQYKAHIMNAILQLELNFYSIYTISQNKFETTHLINNKTIVSPVFFV